jgi:ATP-dependent 26S proteasome regulatory subunit
VVTEAGMFAIREERRVTSFVLVPDIHERLTILSRYL